MKRLFLLICSALVATLSWAQGMPVNGETYYIYNDNANPFYFYNNDGTLALNGSFEAGSPAYLWTAIETGEGTFTLQSNSDATCYLGFKKMENTPFEWTISTEKANAEGNVTLFGKYSDGRNLYFVIKNTGQFDQASGTFNKASGAYSSDFCFVKYEAPNPNARTISITCNLAQARGRFTLQGNTKTGNCTLNYVPTDATVIEPLTGEAGNAAYRFDGFYSDDQNLGTEVDVNTLTVTSLEARFSLDIFSQTYGEKWLRFGTVEDANSAARSSGNDTPMHTTLDVGSEAYLWCFVGTADDYTIYNRAMGPEVALAADGTENGTPVYFTTLDQASHWTLLDTYATADSGAGYVITLQGVTDQGINCYGGKTGFPIKFWRASGDGTHWNFERVVERTITYRLTGTNPYPETNTRVAYIDVLYGGTTAHMSLTNENDGSQNTLFLPTNEQVTVRENVRYHGYQLQDVEYGEDGNITVNIYADPENKYQYLFYSNSPEGHPYRIPAIMCTRKGTLLAINDYRPGGSDIGYGEVDIMLRRSYDNGETWTAPQILLDGVPAQHNTYPYFGYGYGDAAVVADRESDEVLLICVSGKVPYPSATSGWSPCVARLRSHDGGETWGEPEDITSQFFGTEGALLTDSQNGIDCYGGFFGSGKILQSRMVKKGNYYRLYAAMLCRGTNVKGAYVVYSDDFGQTWNLLSPNTVQAASGSDEPKVEELPNGNILLSCRKSYGRYFNVFKFDDDTWTSGTWGNALQSNQQEGGISVGANSCNGEILIVYGKRADGQYPNNIYPIALQSLPWGSGRSNVGLWWKPLSYNTTYNYTSELISRNWTQGLEVSTKGSAYSTMCLQADNRIGFFYEEEPNSYCMVYVPLTLEEITNGQYRAYDPKEDGIISLADDSDAAPTAIYTLSGQRVSKAEKPGIYVMGGRKVLVR
ncbi:MAG: exo-alpha-sialidase [Bacteroidaceae bacterium]|nr:exo-alpha-sialidase [Bacteroidaceae bacterium]